MWNVTELLYDKLQHVTDGTVHRQGLLYWTCYKGQDDKIHDNVPQTAVVTAVIFVAVFIFQEQKPSGQKMMMNDKTKKELIYSIWVHIWKLDKGVDLLNCRISSWQIAILPIHRHHVRQILQQHHCSYVSCNDGVLPRVQMHLYLSVTSGPTLTARYLDRYYDQQKVNWLALSHTTLPQRLRNDELPCC